MSETGNGASGNGNGSGNNGKSDKGFFGKIFSRSKTENVSLKEAVDAYLEDSGFEGDMEISAQEKLLISNVVSLRDLSVTDVMIPRADIAAVDVTIEREALLETLSENQYSRYPVYQDNLDNVIGSIHIKDLIAQLAKSKTLDLRSLIRDVPFVSPAMPVLDLMLLMRQKRRHMVLVIDEYGGIDGLVTIGDIIEEIMGEFQDEYDLTDEAELVYAADGSIIADARHSLEDLEEELGRKFYDDEEEDIDTVGGLVTFLAGRLPARGEVITAEDIGLSIEVIDSDPRRIKRVRLRLFEPVTELQDLSVAG